MVAVKIIDTSQEVSFVLQGKGGTMSSITVPQVEYVGGKTPQESAALLNARIVELRHNNPSFERDGLGFWVTYNKVICEDEEKATETDDKHPRCSDCILFESAGEKVKWGKCKRYGGASVNRNKLACASYWINNLGGDELNA